MDDRGRLAQSLKPEAWSSFVAGRWPRGAGCAAALIIVLASCAYGIVLGNHVTAAASLLRDARDRVANVAGLRVETVALTGNQHMSREEVLAIAGITGTTSLLFLEAEEARERLKANPWIADATVLKLYPRELQITVNERKAFALWQKARAVSVIADDGTVLEPYVAPQLLGLPLVVGSGAESKAKELLALLDRHPAIRDLVRASVFVGERRWNLRMKNGVEVRLPEAGAAAALERLAGLDAQTKLTTRDITIIDLRLHDRVTVRLSDAAAQARMEAMEKPKKKTTLLGFPFAATPSHSPQGGGGRTGLRGPA